MFHRQKYKCFLWLLLLLSVLGTAGYGYHTLDAAIPDEIKIYPDEEHQLEQFFTAKLITYEDSLEVVGSDSYTIECKILNFIPLKTVKVQNVAVQSVEVSGDTIGIYMETEGVLIIDTGEIMAADGINIKPAENIVRGGDYIMSVNGIALNSKQELIDIVDESEGELLELAIRRQDDLITLSLEPALTQDGSYKLGIWVRDNIQGIGTLTYIDENNSFGALGHGINDVDTGELLKLGNGKIYQAEILSITKGSQGNPGELRGVINYQDTELLGDIESNQNNGIRGGLSDSGIAKIEKTTVPIGLKQDLSIGAATILCNIEGSVKEYQIEITDIDWNQEDTNKSFSIRVTDSQLLELTGGIVQGMSGSPILQNGKLVGAVTHVLIQDATKGYGIFIENMINLKN